MKKGICYGTLAGDTIEQRFELAKAAGFEGVEINTQENSPDRKKFKSVAEENGIDFEFADELT